MKRYLVFIIVAFLSIAGNFCCGQTISAGDMVYFKDRKWDLRQIHVDNVKADSAKVVNLRMGMAFTTEGFFYQIQPDSATGELFAAEYLYQLQAIGPGYQITVYETAPNLDRLYLFTVVYIAKDHLVLKWDQTGPNNVVKHVEYRFVADNSVDQNTSSSGAP